MPDNEYKEVLIVLISCSALFLLLAAIILFFLFIYMRRRFQQQQQLSAMALQFKEQTLNAQLEIQEQTFHAISQEIHDNVGQILSLAKVQINILDQRQELDITVLHNIRDNVGKAMADLRDLSRSLNGDRIRSLSLYNAVLGEAQRINHIGTFKCQVQFTGEPRQPDEQKKILLFRTIQECLHNCMKHSEATIVNITFEYETTRMKITIIDDGKGFLPASNGAQEAGQGLQNMQTRIRLAGGVHELQTAPGNGTQITLTVPYE